MTGGGGNVAFKMTQYHAIKYGPVSYLNLRRNWRSRAFGVSSALVIIICFGGGASGIVRGVGCVLGLTSSSNLFESHGIRLGYTKGIYT